MKSTLINSTLAAFFLVFCTSMPVTAQTTATPTTKSGVTPAAAPATDMVEAEVRKVDKDTKKITLKHAEIPNLEMPGMTMVFQVKDPTMLDMVKSGDKVKFKAEKSGGAFVITELQAVK